MLKKSLLGAFVVTLVATGSTYALAEFTNVPSVEYKQEDVNKNGVLDAEDLKANQEGKANKDENPLNDPKKFPRYKQTEFGTGKVVEDIYKEKPKATVKQEVKKQEVTKEVVKKLPNTSAYRG